MNLLCIIDMCLFYHIFHVQHDLHIQHTKFDDERIHHICRLDLICEFVLTKKFHDIEFD